MDGMKELFDTSAYSTEPEPINPWTFDLEGDDDGYWQQPRKSNERSEQPDDTGTNSSSDKVEHPEAIDSAGLSTTPLASLKVKSQKSKGKRINSTFDFCLLPFAFPEGGGGHQRCAGGSRQCESTKPPFAIAPQPQLPESAPTVATLCTGGGLFEVGAMIAGFRPIWGVESDPDNPDASGLLADCYERNFGAHIIRKTVEEVASVGFKHLERPTVLHVSQPCKSFSAANSKREADGDLKTARAVCCAIEELQPPIVTVENVTSYRNSQCWSMILQVLTQQGYEVEEATVNAADYGVPQKRQRFLAYALKGQAPPKLPEKMTPIMGWYSAIADLIPTLPESQLADWQLERIQNLPSQIQNGEAYLIERTGAWKKRDLLVRAGTSPSWTIKAGIATDQKGANRHDPLNVMLPDGKVLSLNARAIARLQSVPDWYQLPDQIGIAVTLLGNGVPCLLAEVLMRTLKSVISHQPTVNSPIVSAEVVELEELTFDEQRERDWLERKVERAFYQAGKALKQLRDQRLYRSTHKTFEDYCRDRFGFGRHAANRLIAGADVVENLVTIGHQNQPEQMVTNCHQNQSFEDLVTNGTQILPTNECQVRPLVGLEPSQQREVWQQAVTQAGGKVPSGRTVSELVKRIKERTANSQELSLAHHLKLNLGGLVEISAPNNNKIHQRLGRIAAVHERTVEVWARDVDTMTMMKHTLKHQQVEPKPKEKVPQLKEVCDRLKKLRECGLDPLEVEILNLLDRTVFQTPLELEYLAQIEKRYEAR